MKKTTLTLLLLVFCAATWPALSIFSLQSMWKTDTEQEVSLSSLAGEQTLLTLIYSHCASACPLAIHKLQEVKSMADEQELPVKIALVSMDSRQDTPRRLAQFRKVQKLSQEWTLLSGVEENIRELAVAIGFSYQRDEKTGEFQHSNKIVLLDSSGVIKEWFDGTNVSAEAILEKLRS